MIGLYLWLLFGLFISLRGGHIKDTIEYSISNQSYLNYMNGKDDLINVHRQRTYHHSQSYYKLKRIVEAKKSKPAKSRVSKRFRAGVKPGISQRFNTVSRMAERKKRLWFIERYIVVEMLGDIILSIWMPHYRRAMVRKFKVHVRTKYVFYRNHIKFRLNDVKALNPLDTPILHYGKMALPRAVMFIIISAVIINYAINPDFNMLLPFKMFGMAGTAYYVSFSLGDDDNDGLSESTPKKTSYEMFRQSMSYGNDDVIYYYNADTWVANLGAGDRMHPNSVSASDGHEVIIDGSTWGPGTKAIIDCDGGTTTINTYIYLEQGGTNASHLYFLNLDIRDAGGTAVSINGDCENVSFEQVDISDCGSNAIIGKAVVGFMVDNCTVNNFGLVGISVTADYGHDTEDIVFRDNTVYQDSISAHDGMQSHLGPVESEDYGQGPIVMYNNSVSGGGEQSFDHTAGENMVLLGNEAFNSNGGIVFGHKNASNGTPTHCAYMYIHDCDPAAWSFHVFFNAPNVRFYNNLIVINNECKLPLILDHQASDNTGPNNVRIYYNTFIISASSEGHFRLGNDNGGYTGDLIFKNNSVYVSSASNDRMWDFATADPSMDDVTPGNWDYNNYYYESGTFAVTDYNVDNITWATWQTAGFDVNSSMVNPNMVDPTGETSGFPDDAKLSSGSGLIDAATSISTGTYYSNGDSDITTDNVSSYAMTGIAKDYYDENR